MLKKGNIGMKFDGQNFGDLKSIFGIQSLDLDHFKDWIIELCLHPNTLKICVLLLNTALPHV